MIKTKRKQLLMMLGDQEIPAQMICSSCLYATTDGQPRWRSGKLGCGIPVQLSSTNEVEFDCVAGGKVFESPDD
jgi:hypothetical protein